MTLIYGGASMAANSWAFDAAGVVLWLSAPLSRATLVWSRALASAAAMLILLGAVAVSSAAAGFSSGAGDTAAFSALFLPVVVCAGLRTATKYPSVADLDSLRGRPTTPWAALSYTARAAVGAALLSGAVSAGGPGPAAATAVACYCLWALWALRASARALRDGGALVSAFAVSR